MTRQKPLYWAVFLLALFELLPSGVRGAELAVVTCSGVEHGTSVPKDVEVNVSDEIAQKLNAYAGNIRYVIGPRGWHCFTADSGNGDYINVFPDSEFLENGPLVAMSDSNASGTGGGYSRAEFVCRYFPHLGRGCRHGVWYPQPPLPAEEAPRPVLPGTSDHLSFQNKYMIEFETPAHATGLGTNGLFAPLGRSEQIPANLPTDGLLIEGGFSAGHHRDTEGGMELFKVRLPTKLRYLQRIILAIEQQTYLAGKGFIQQ